MTQSFNYDDNNNRVKIWTNRLVKTSSTFASRIAVTVIRDVKIFLPMSTTNSMHV